MIFCQGRIETKTRKKILAGFSPGNALIYESEDPAVRLQF